MIKTTIKIHLLSDLHNEVEEYNQNPPEDVDFILLAGDIHAGSRVFGRIFEKYPTKNVIYTTGNHEYWRNNVQKFDRELRDKFNVGLYNQQHRYLQNDIAIYPEQNIAFFGATLWTDYNLYHNPELAKYYAIRQINDFVKIQYNNDWIEPRDTQEMHQHTVSEAKKLIEATRLTYPDIKIVIMTHMAPSIKSVAPKYGNDPLNAYFASNLESLMFDLKPNLWVHGHTHTSFDYKIGSTRVVCNPRGYGNENKEFNPNLIIEV